MKNLAIRKENFPCWRKNDWQVVLLPPLKDCCDQRSEEIVFFVRMKYIIPIHEMVKTYPSFPQKTDSNVQ